MLSPLPVVPSNSKSTGADPTELVAASRTVAVSVAVLELLPELGTTTATEVCRLRLAADAAGALIAKVRVRLLSRTLLASTASACTVTAPEVFGAVNVAATALAAGV